MSAALAGVSLALAATVLAGRVRFAFMDRPMG